MAEGFFDIQVNGYAGVDFNQDGLNAEELHRLCQRLRDDGVAGILATITTETIERMAVRLARIVQLRAADALVREVIAGFHIEGPFLNETAGFRGCHPAEAIRPADTDLMNRLLEAAGGLTRIVTLAPERDAGMKLTRMLAGRRIKVAAGHTDASRDELRAAIDAGLTMFTHLGNGCPMQMHRHDNIIQRALGLHEELWLTFIADGAHVPFFALGNYLRSVDLDRCVVVTDAISAAGMGPGRYTLGRWDILVGPDMVARAPDGSHLVGSACPLKLAYANLIEKVGLSENDALRLVTVNPHKAIGQIS